MSYKGKYSPINPSKYRGDPTRIVYRSLWERRVMKFFDQSPNIIEWQSEEVVVPYKSPKDGRYHRYFPDFVIWQRDRSGSIVTKMIEVKPLKEVVGPKPKAASAKPSRRYIIEVVTYAINVAKWDAARAFCADRKWEFVILTEKELGL